MHPVLLALTVIAVWIVVAEVRTFIRRRHLPPGPPGLPLLGNALQMPTDLPWKHFHEYGKTYGSVMSFNAAGQIVIVLNDLRSAFELLDRRGSNYSHRPRLIKAGQLLGGGISFPFMPYTTKSRTMRRIVHETYGAQDVHKLQRTQELEATNLVHDLLQHPESWYESAESSISSVIMTATYGWPRIDDDSAVIVSEILGVASGFTHASLPGSSVVDIFPILNHLPSWIFKEKRDALLWHEQKSRMFEELLDDVERREKAGDATECFAATLLRDPTAHGLSRREAAWLSGLMMAAGAETTTISLHNFFLAMLHFPQVMRKAQAEIDEVVGRERMPTHVDRAHLPYTSALLKEIFRFMPAASLGLPHCVAEVGAPSTEASASNTDFPNKDDSFESFLIPQGAIIIPNIWAINRDPSVYEDPDEFLPERHLAANGVDDVAPDDTHGFGHSGFGFGRRICSGLALADQALFIDYATLLWAFNIEAAVDEDGRQAPFPSVSDVITSGIAARPKPFKCSIVPRSPDIWDVVERTRDERH
ncbi:hypothetical protein EIP91_002106 [Steccherinum ochraceum]|uniref:Cytochrome P450 n=1 Tax=Steccherinum ochraceum TaxID=92696 RepID=A0A4R0RPF7_9APHY|nr:hypothetical protein EIP91_002106 [Steccherinum ochraceum]